MLYGQTDPIKVDFKVPELFQSKISVGQALSVSLDAIPGQPFTGRVFAVNPQLDTAGRAVVLRAQMDNRGGALKLYPFLTARQRAELEAIPPIQASKESVLNASINIARAFFPRAKRLAAARGLTWPSAMEDAMRAHLKRTLDIAL